MNNNVKIVIDADIQNKINSIKIELVVANYNL